MKDMSLDWCRPPTVLAIPVVLKPDDCKLWSGKSGVDIKLIGFLDADKHTIDKKDMNLAVYSLVHISEEKDSLEMGVAEKNKQLQKSEEGAVD
jgi:hypothetical protein